MLGIEMMISNLTGMKAGEIKEASEMAMRLIQSAAKDMEEIKLALVRLEERLNMTDGDKANGRRKLANGDGNSSRSNEHIQL